MIGCFRFFLKIFPVIIMLIALILTGLSQGGSRTKDVGFNASTYLIKIDLSNANMDKVFSNHDQTIHQMGFSELYSFGLWGYCKGSRAGASTSTTSVSTSQEIKEWFSSGDYNVTFCSKPKALFTLDITNILLNDITNSKSISINLPTAVSDQNKSIKTTGHVVFVVLLIGVTSLGLSMLCILFSFLLPSIVKFAVGFGLIALLALIIGAASSLVVFTKLMNNLNDAVEAYGIIATLAPKKFYGMLWAAVVLTFIALIFSLVSCCLLRSTNRERTRTQMSQEENPFMGYEQK